MAKREWISRMQGIYRTETGAIYARDSIPGLGRKEFSLGKRFDGPISEIPPKQVQSWINLKERKVADLIRQKQPKPNSLIRFEDLALEIVESKKMKADSTFESAYIHVHHHLLPFINERYPYLYEWEEKGESIWQEYIDYKRSISPQIKFMNHRKHLRMVLLRAFERGIIKRKIKLYDPDPEIDVGRVLEASEIKRLYQVASPTLKIQILMAFTMGLRKSEILRLEWKRVDLDKNELIFLRSNTKTRKPRVVPMNQWVRRDLVAREKHKVGPYVFWSRYNRNAYQKGNKSAWTRAKRLAHVQARFHDLRHTFITNAVRSGMNPILICKYAGLSQEVMASVYCHLDTTDLRSISGKLGGRLGGLLK